MPSKKVQQRQGDLFFCESTIDSSKLKKKNDAILAHGEVTGHAHRVCSPDLSEVDMFVDDQGHIYLRSDKDIVISHDEHGTITLPGGKEYCMTRQREYDAISAEKERKVAD